MNTVPTNYPSNSIFQNWGILLNISCIYFPPKIPSTLKSLFIIKSGPYGMRSTNSFIGTICKSNIRSFNVVKNLWNPISNDVKVIYSNVSYKNSIKTMLLNPYSWNFTCLYNYIFVNFTYVLIQSMSITYFPCSIV